MLRFFAFRIASRAFHLIMIVARFLSVWKRCSTRNSRWSDRQLDDKLMELRSRLQAKQPSARARLLRIALKEQWKGEQTIKTVEGEVEVTVPAMTKNWRTKKQHRGKKTPEARQSIHIQAKLARIGAVMGFKVWIPRSDRGRVGELLQAREQAALLQDLPLNLDDTTMYTIEQIDVLWLRGRAIFRAFEVEQTTAVYSGLLRMADLLALQPNMDIKLHIVAPDERRDRVFNEMKRPVFSVLERGPLSRRSSFLSYESVDAMNAWSIWRIPMTASSLNMRRKPE